MMTRFATNTATARPSTMMTVRFCCAFASGDNSTATPAQSPSEHFDSSQPQPSRRTTSSESLCLRVSVITNAARWRASMTAASASYLERSQQVRTFSVAMAKPPLFLFLVMKREEGAWRYSSHAVVSKVPCVVDYGSSVGRDTSVVVTRVAFAVKSVLPNVILRRVARAHVGDGVNLRFTSANGELLTWRGYVIARIRSSLLLIKFIEYDHPLFFPPPRHASVVIRSVFFFPIARMRVANAQEAVRQSCFRRLLPLSHVTIPATRDCPNVLPEKFSSCRAKSRTCCAHSATIPSVTPRTTIETAFCQLCLPRAGFRSDFVC